MALYTIQSCGENESPHICTGCPDVEGARVRAMAFERDGITWVDKEDATEWQTKMDAGDVIVIPNTNGSSDGGTPAYKPGYGNIKQRYVNTTTKITYKDPDYEENRNFYNDKLSSGTWKPMMVTENLVHSFDAVCTIVAKDPVEDDMDAEVVWVVDVEVTHSALSTKTEKPANIFHTCYGDTN